MPDRGPEKPSAALDAHDYTAMLEVAQNEAQIGFAEGGIPVGAAIFDPNGLCLSVGRNRRVQDGDPSAHAETDAFRRAGRRPTYRDLTMVTTLAPCWYCAGLIRQFAFRAVVVGDSENYTGGLAWLRASGIELVDLASPACIARMRLFIEASPQLWGEDIGR